ncbi:glycosyltransferase family 2 protein [Bosea sp. 124]|uniref:glycosyltransferase family 2 protein n=1 Tax=Bosea sp. 124 TaxID=2135642 RepID=UPI000D391217|nr:glycosyltransferase family 2 protein [Bosea sp. 124]PTM41754.1 glycosyl transferase family 2 [Bosea sp. 124]
MRCPTLADLPPPPSGKTGWPWTEECSRLPELRPDGTTWPRISIVTPSYNQGQFLEETIRSILLQGYPDLEYIIIDGYSVDDSAAITDKYATWLSHWESEKDDGQAHAINKGLKRATGAIFQWINSDDRLTPHALKNVALLFDESSTIAGHVNHFGGERTFLSGNLNLTALTLLHHAAPYNLKRLFALTNYDQPGVWLSTKIIKEVGGFDESKNYIFDLSATVFYLRVAQKILYTNQILVEFRHHAQSKTESVPELFYQEHTNFLHQLANERIYGLSKHARRILLAIEFENSAGDIFNLEKKRVDRLRHLARMIREFPKMRSARFYLGALKNIIFQAQVKHNQYEIR